MMQPGGMPPQGDVMGKLKGMRSMFNPADLSMMKQDGEISPDMTIEQFLGKMGVTPQDPVSKLAEVFKGQMANADPMNKMKGIAGGAGSAQPQGAPQGPPPGLDGLIGA
jgi:hypothetical protein